ncbi:MAG: hypothetical protein M9934_07945 [Thermomicrobiales bacterium]|nr:hypothetical protein [Thermomicrobiales bacterium]
MTTLSKQLKRAAFSIGRRMGKHPLTARVFCLLERMLPVERLARSEHCVAFHHPRPSWNPHILVVPTVPFPAIGTQTIQSQQQFALMWEMVQLANRVADDLNLDDSLTMTINGGTRQEIGQMHGHLTTLLPASDTIVSLVLGDPDIDPEPWNALLHTWCSIAAVPGSGYSLMMDIRGEENARAWLMQSTHDPV